MEFPDNGATCDTSLVTKQTFPSPYKHMHNVIHNTIYTRRFCCFPPQVNNDLLQITYISMHNFKVKSEKKTQHIHIMYVSHMFLITTE
jgi:hypothetical protein